MVGEKIGWIKGKPFYEAIYKSDPPFFLSSNSWAAIGSLAPQAPEGLRCFLHPMEWVCCW